MQKEESTGSDENKTYSKTIVAVTACPAGIAHTYMAAEALVKAGEELGVKVYVEKQGANGVEDRHTAERLANADAAIFAVDVAVKEIERFNHLPVFKTKVAEPIRNGKKVIEDALKKAETFEKSEYVAKDEPEEKNTLFSDIKKSVLTGISYIIPIIVAGGMINAFAILITQVFGLQDIMAAEQSWLWCFKSMGGQMLGTIMIPVLSAYMAYSLGDKTALAPGFAAGIAANIIGGGFLCGMLGGIIAGYTVRFLRKTIPAKGTLAGFVSFWGYPVLSTIIVGIGIFLILGKPVAWINTVLIDFLGSMSGSNGAILGAILGIMFGIKRCMFWRGTSERMGSDKTEFFWEGDDNSKVTVQLLPLGYAIGKYLPADHEALKQRMDKYLPVLDRGATTEHILLPNGHDQMPVQKNIFDVMKSIEECYPGRVTKISRYEEIFDIIEKNKNLDTLKGEFLDGKYMRVHRSIYSSRADLKSSNTRIENKITNILEPLASIAYSLGFDYHHGLIEAIWKELMKNHAHDSIGCCCSDKVHRAIADRFFLAEDRTDCLIEFYKRKITDAMSCDITLDKFVVFNTLPYARNEVVTGEIITKMKGFVLEDEKGNRPDFEILSSEIVDAGLIDRQIVHYGDYDPFVKYTVDFMDEIPSMGFKTYFVKKTETEFTALEKNTLVEKQENVLENSFYKITVEDNGTLTVFDKNSEKSYSNVLMLEDGSDDGDGYDFSPLENDFVLTSENSKAQRTVSKSENISKAVITVDMDVPKNLESRKAKLADGKISVEFTVILEKDSKIIKISAKVNNYACDHRLRVLIPAGMNTENSLSDNQFGIIKRPVVDSAMEIWEKERWSERPDSIYPFLSFVCSDNKNGMAVLTDSIREYELVGESFDKIAVTLFRGVGVLGKENLFRRPGRPSGIKMETPDSQMLGENVYDFAITSDCEKAQTLAKEYTTPLVCYNKMPYNAMKLNTPEISAPYTYSMLSLDNKALTVSAVKKEEKGNAILIRICNASGKAQNAEIKSQLKAHGEVNLDETIKADSFDMQNIIVNENQIRTLALSLK